jgi:hypothetical protein
VFLKARLVAEPPAGEHCAPPDRETLVKTVPPLVVRRSDHWWDGVP